MSKIGKLPNILPTKNIFLNKIIIRTLRYQNTTSMKKRHKIDWNCSEWKSNKIIDAFLSIYNRLQHTPGYHKLFNITDQHETAARKDISWMNFSLSHVQYEINGEAWGDFRCRRTIIHPQSNIPVASPRRRGEQKTDRKKITGSSNTFDCYKLELVYIIEKDWIGRG